MTYEAKKDLVESICRLAGKLGEEETLPGAHDAKEYEHQVLCGLASAAVAIIGHNTHSLSDWLSLVFGRMGYPNNPRLDELREEIWFELDRQVTKVFQEGVKTDELPSDLIRIFTEMKRQRLADAEEDD